MALFDRKSAYFKLGPWQKIDLADEVDIILMRQDPPFDMAYITATHFLEKLHPCPLVVNNPREVRNAPEKLWVTEFADLTPATLIGRSFEEVQQFHQEYGDIIIKPLFANGGEGVFLLRKDDVNLQTLHAMFCANGREPYIAQQFLPEISAGDKRVILVDGEPIALLNRLPAKGQIRANLHIGGQAEPGEMTDIERRICERIGPFLRERGLIFAGIDIIGDKVTEINVTSPTCLQEARKFYGVNGASLIFDAIEQHLAKYKR